MNPMKETEAAAIIDAIVVDWDVPITMDDGTVLPVSYTHLTLPTKA